jgi:hypothetical protein
VTKAYRETTFATVEVPPLTMERATKASSKAGIVTAEEPFVAKEAVVQLTALPARRVLELARNGTIRAYPIGNIRNQWRFRLSEVAEDIAQLRKPPRSTISAAAPRAGGE